MNKKNDKESLFCSFCGKSQKEVKKLIAGPTVFVCDECVELCMDIIKEDSKNSKSKIKKDTPKPSQINQYLNDYVIGQSNAKKAEKKKNEIEEKKEREKNFNPKERNKIGIKKKKIKKKN